MCPEPLIRGWEATVSTGMPWILAHLDACVQHDLASATIARHAAGMSWGLYFAFYNRAKDRYQRWTGQSKLAPQVHLLSAAEAGCVVSP